MKNFKKTMLISFILFMVAGVMARAEDVSVRVNIALPDGTIMMYSGTEKGINTGDEFEVSRGGNMVGHIRITKVKEFFSYAELIDGDVQEMDLATRTKVGEKTENKEDAGEKSDEKKTVKTAKKDKDTKKEAAKEEDSTTSSKRREDAKKEDKKTEKPAKDEKSTEKKPADDKTKEKKDETQGPKFVYKEDKYATKLKPLGMLRPAAHGLTGLLFMPTANSLPKGRGNAYILYVNSDSEYYSYTDVGLGVDYGLNEDIEISFTRVGTQYDIPILGRTYSYDTDTNVFSLKYQFDNSQAISFLGGRESQARYAAGLQYYSESAGSTSSGTEDEDTDALRLFAVMALEHSMGTSHYGLYYQSGDMLDDSDYEGFGYMLGFEYPLGKKEGSLSDYMSIIGEYDSKAFYLGTYRTPSLGLRYNFRHSAHITLGLMDLTETSSLLLNGAYDF